LSNNDGRFSVLLGVAPAAAVTLGAAVTGHVPWPAACAIVAALAVAPVLAGLRPARVAATAPAAAGAPPAFAAVDLLERLPDPAILLNGRREVVACNRQARESLGIAALGRDLALSLRHPDILAAADAVVDDAPPLSEEVTLPSPITRTFTLFAAGLPAVADPEAPRVLLMLRDETQLKRSEQSRADFVANATHELRSPLSAIIGFIETLRGAASDDEEARHRFLALMHGEAQRMARLIEDLMSLARVEINEHVLPRVAVDVREVVVGVA
jgi:two-component system phosphate regulon sensor histidine kinase PhoR